MHAWTTTCQIWSRESNQPDTKIEEKKGRKDGS